MTPACIFCHQRDIGGLNRNVTVHCTHCHTDIGCFECRRVIYTVTYHADFTASHHFCDILNLVFRQQIGTDVGNANLCCKAYRTAFSFDVEEGGYMHENGEYTMETSLVLTLIDADKNVIMEIARDLCAFFHQESVLITEDHVRTFYVKETFESED